LGLSYTLSAFEPATNGDVEAIEAFAPRNFLDWRIKMAALLVLDGVQAKELRDLALSDLHLDLGVINTLSGVFPLSPYTKEYLLAYLKIRPQYGANQYLLPTETGKGIKNHVFFVNRLLSWFEEIGLGHLNYQALRNHYVMRVLAEHPNHSLVQIAKIIGQDKSVLYNLVLTWGDSGRS